MAAPFRAGVNMREMIARDYNRIVRHNKERRGQKNECSLSREEIEDCVASSKVFGAAHALNDENIFVNIRPWIIGSDSYPPSRRPLSSLKPIMLDSMLIQMRHNGRVAILRTFTKPNFDVCLCAGVEDPNGKVDFVILQNTDPSHGPNDVLPKGLVIAVKEPLYQTFRGKHGIVVEHPSDMIELDLSSPMMPSIWKEDIQSRHSSDAERLKNAGNVARAAGLTMNAARLYTMGLASCDATNVELCQHLYRNRALVNISLGRHQQAREDALQSLISSSQVDSTTNTLNAKANFRAGRASYELGHYDEALHYFEKSQALDANDSTKRELNRALLRVDEAKTGKYDFEMMSNSVKLGNAQVDAASFFANTNVKGFRDGRGTGLLATKDMCVGDLIMAEKAFCATFSHDSPSNAHTNLTANMTTRRVYTHFHARLVAKTIQKVVHNACVAHPILHLWATPYPRPHHRDHRALRDISTRGVEVVDGQTVANSFFIESIVEDNNFNLPLLRTADMQVSVMQSLDKIISRKPWEKFAAGIFPYASMLKEATSPNAIHAYIGDFMILRAARDIKKGEELSISCFARNHDIVRKTLEELMHENMGFDCHCDNCKTDAKKRFEAANEENTGFFCPCDTCRAEILTARDIYPRDVHEILVLDMLNEKGRGRPVVTEPGVGDFCKVRYMYEPFSWTNVDMHKYLMFEMIFTRLCPHENDGALLLKQAVYSLRHRGLKVALKRDTETLTVKFKAYKHNIHTVDAAVFASIACKKLGMLVLSERFAELAQLIWKTYAGAAVGFERMYGNRLAN